MLYRTFLFLFLALSLSSCNKKSETNSKISETKLPNFGNVDVDKIFTDTNNSLQNEDSVKKTIRNYYENVWEKGNLSGGLLVAKGNNILFEDYRGFGQVNDKMPIDKNTPLHVASVSKTMTAMATMKLVEGGLLKLDDHLTKFFPKFPYPEVTVFNLLTQRSGLPKYELFIEKIDPAAAEMKKKYLTNQDILNLLTAYKPELARPTNSGFMYCNTNFAMLALIVEKVTKMPFPQAMQEILFRPLKMDHTYIYKEKDSITASRSFFNGNNRLYPLDHLDLIYGDKNVYTTPRDLLNFSKALYAKNFLRADLMKLVFEPHSNENPGINNYGVGFRMKIFDNGEKLTYHNGWWHGSNAVFAHLLKSNVTIIAIGNKYSSRVYSALSLSGLFEDFPYETEKLLEVTNPKDSLKTDEGAE
ncbi:serine hydrolase domain-containing protein [Halpernia frigidisoli]|uniref:CubicO group peptidase, beta-lactamase class C family n=1 Tax=Halpernia frigidisoli TaxID=1125876 RepID=A0A1I3I5J9_9FLAO|nr:serine hydrolase domain-containing protein [Halpernia frigidisoli]SFI43053.1 CubicO group peptidase, beta-lactamase class C family [Halpernia frigidisoli]